MINEELEKLNEMRITTAQTDALCELEFELSLEKSFNFWLITEATYHLLKSRGSSIEADGVGEGLLLGKPFKILPDSKDFVLLDLTSKVRHVETLTNPTKSQQLTERPNHD